MKQSKYIPGDWVKASGQLCRVEEVFVNRLTKEFEYTLVYPNGNPSRIVIGEIEPVPLTPEILEKSGWVREDGIFGVSGDFKKNIGDPAQKKRDIICLSVYPFFDDDAFSFFCNNQKLDNIHYVNELQHLLFGLDDNSEIKV